MDCVRASRVGRRILAVYPHCRSTGQLAVEIFDATL
jgi:hypothetical protein